MPAHNIWIMIVIMIVVLPIGLAFLENSVIQQRFIQKILKNRCVYYITAYSLRFFNLLLFLLGFCFPSWWIYILGGVWIGTIGELIPHHYSRGNFFPLSYKEAYDKYITHADRLEQKRKKRK